MFWKYLKIHFKSFAILKMHFPVKFRPYKSALDKVTAFLIFWKFDREIDSDFHNDVTWLVDNFGFVEKNYENRFLAYLIAFLCNFTKIEVIGINFGCRSKSPPPL